MIRISQRDNYKNSLFAFAFKLSDAVDGTNPIKSQGQIVFKNASGYDCGISMDSLSTTAYVFIYSHTPKTLYLPDLSEDNLNRAIAFVRSDGQEKQPYLPNTDRELLWQKPQKR